MFATMRRHHHPVDNWEPDDAEEIAEDATLEEIRHCTEWDLVIDLAGSPERRGSATRRRRERARLNRAWRRRAGRG
jgi:hypothetical protein